MTSKKKIKMSVIIITLSAVMSHSLYAEEVQALVVCNGSDHSSNGSCPAIVEVPEPSTIAIFALGIMGLALRRYKK